MAFRLKRRESVAAGIRRIADEQLAGALAELRSDSLSDATKVHQLRKHCKKLRALIRLVHPAFEEFYSAENRWYRDTARALSDARDAHTSLNTWNILRQQHKSQLSRAARDHVSKQLRRAGQQEDSRSSLDGQLQLAKRRLQAARERVPTWSLEEESFEAIRGGLGRTYRSARVAMREACSAHTTEHFHEWRKHAKYHWYHCRLLCGLWPPVMRVRRQEIQRLAELLGHDHDLAVLTERLVDSANGRTGRKAGRAVSQLVLRQRRCGQQTCIDLGQRLFADSTHAFVRRVEVWWQVWKGI